MALALAVPAFAIEESEVEAAVNATSREEVTGNVLIWFLCAVAFLKVSQKIDSFMSSIGVNVGHTGGSMLAEAMVAARGISVATGATGKVIGGFGKGRLRCKGRARLSRLFRNIPWGTCGNGQPGKVTNDAGKNRHQYNRKSCFQFFQRDTGGICGSYGHTCRDCNPNGWGNQQVCHIPYCNGTKV